MSLKIIVHFIRVIKNNYIFDILFNKRQTFFYKIFKHLPLNIQLITIKIKPNKKKEDFFLLAKLYDQSSNEKLFYYYNEYEKLIKSERLAYFGNKICIPKSQFTGSIGCFFHIYSIIEASLCGLYDKKILISYLNKSDLKKIQNIFLFDYFKDFVSIYENNYNKSFDYPIGHYLPIKNYVVPLKLAHNYVITKKIKKKINFYFNLTEDDKKRGRELLINLNLKFKFIVTLHIREEGFHNDKSEFFRNADIDDYIPSIKYIVKKGGVVFRMGDSSMKALPKIDGLIDYSQWENKDKFLEMYLANESIFCIGSSSGYTMLPYIMGRPIILSNTGTIDDYFILRNQDYFLPKVLRNKKNNENIKLKNIFNFPMSSWWYDYKNKMKKNNVELINNDKIDILKTVISLYLLTIKEKDIKNNKISLKYKKDIESTNLSRLSSIDLKAHGNISTSFLFKYKLI